jgi:hypothetical protein
MNLPPSIENVSIPSSTFIFGESGEYVDRELRLDIRQMRRKEGYAKNGLYYSPYNDFSILPQYESVWAYSPDYNGDFHTSIFIFIFSREGVLSHIHYNSIMPNGKWRCWLSVGWEERTIYFSKSSRYKRFNTYNIPGHGGCDNDIIDGYTWMNKFGDYLKADVKQYYQILLDLFGVNPISNPFWEW